MTPAKMVKIIEERNLNVEFFGEKTSNCWIFGGDGEITRTVRTGGTIVEAFESALREFDKQKKLTQGEKNDRE